MQYRILILLWLAWASASADPVIESEPYPPDEPQPTHFELFINNSTTPIQVSAALDKDGYPFLLYDFDGGLQWDDKLSMRACNDVGCGDPLDWSKEIRPPRMRDVFIRRAIKPLH